MSAVAIGKQQGGPVIVANGSDGTLRAWDLDSGRSTQAQLTAHPGTVSAMTTGEPDGWPVVVSGGGDGTVRVWDLEWGDTLLPLYRQDAVVSAVAFGEWQGRPVVVCGGATAACQVPLRDR